jgi:hypothetical protein
VEALGDVDDERVVCLPESGRVNATMPNGMAADNIIRRETTKGCSRIASPNALRSQSDSNSRCCSKMS